MLLPSPANLLQMAVAFAIGSSFRTVFACRPH
jgi:hypothetical protein